MTTSPHASTGAVGWSEHPLFRALHERRSRRFALGGSLDGALPYRSEASPVPLSDLERAILSFAACGVTGWALNDMELSPAGAGTMMAGLVGRTVSSVDALQAVALVVTDDDGTWLVRRAADMEPDDVRALIDLADRGDHLEIFRRQRVELAPRRTAPPLEPPTNIPLNRWALHGPGTTYFLPIGDLTLPYINVALEFFNEENAMYPLDERARFAPAGVRRFSSRRGGHLDEKRAGTIREFEIAVAELVTVELGMMLQNLGLACDALGLGGYPNYAGDDITWYEHLGFRMGELPLSRFLGADAVVRTVMRARKLDEPMRFPLGLEGRDEPLLISYRPPYFPTMRAAVEAAAERKLGPAGIYRKQALENSAWSNPEAVSSTLPDISDAAVEATVAYCSYVWDRYGRFPAHLPAFRTSVGFQASHLDVGFYDTHYRPEALPDRHRNHLSSALHR